MLALTIGVLVLVLVFAPIILLEVFGTRHSEDRAQVSLTFTTRCSIEGVCGDLVLSAPSLAELRKAIRAFPMTGIEVAAPATASPVAQDVPPLCSIHNRPMKPSKAPGQWFCSAQLEDGSGYCREKRKAG